MTYHVLTGGPCTGKTTLTGLLEEQGYKVLPESARAIHAERPTFVQEDFLSFERAVLERQLSLENELKTNPDLLASRSAFLDRSVIDVFAYCVANGYEPSYLIEDAANRAVEEEKYDTIYLLEPVPYKNDEERHETLEEAFHIHETIAQTYKDFGYELIHVPDFNDLEKRLRFVIENQKPSIHLFNDEAITKKLENYAGEYSKHARALLSVQSYFSKVTATYFQSQNTTDFDYCIGPSQNHSKGYTMQGFFLEEQRDGLAVIARFVDKNGELVGKNTLLAREENNLYVRLHNEHHWGSKKWEFTDAKEGAN